MLEDHLEQKRHESEMRGRQLEAEHQKITLTEATNHKLSDDFKQIKAKLQKVFVCMI